MQQYSLVCKISLVPFSFTVFKCSEVIVYQYIPIHICRYKGTMCKNKRITIKDFTNNLYCSYFQLLGTYSIITGYVFSM